MNKIFLFVLTNMLMTTFAHALESKYCVQEIPDAEYDISALYYVVQIKETKNIQEIRSSNNSFDVHIKLSLENEYASSIHQLKQFSAVAKSNGINYDIDSAKQNGFEFHVDLEDQSRAEMIIYNQDGSQENIHLNCQ